jgi:hypothetical protein
LAQEEYSAKFMQKPFNYYLLKYDRIAIWIVAVFFAIYVVSGYGIVNPGVVSELTGGILTRTIALYLHETLDLPILMLLLVHVLIQLRFTLLRWKVKDGMLLNSFVIVLGVFAIALLLLMDPRI